MFHLRFTPYDISGYTFNFLDIYDKYILAREDFEDDGTPLLHYHILIDTDYEVQSIRNAAKSALKIPVSGKGKNNKYYALITDWKDPGYICKYNNVIKSKGFSEKEIMEYVISGRKTYPTFVGGKVESLSPGDAVAGELGQRPARKQTKLDYQRTVICEAMADWYDYKRECRENDTMISKDKVVDFVCKSMRKNGRGINQYLVKELALAVLYDDQDYQTQVLVKIKSFCNL